MLQAQPLRYRVALVLKTLFYPLTFPDALESLKARKFDVPGAIPSIPIGLRSYARGPVATKDDVTVDLDPDRKIVATEGKSVENVLKVFEELTSLLHDDYSVDLDNDADYVEVAASLLIKTKGIAREKIEGLFAEVDKVEKLRSVLQFDPVIRSFTISQKDKPPESKEYVELSVNYRVTVKDTYYIEAIYRDRSVAKTLSFAKSINSKALNLVGLIESLGQKTSKKGRVKRVE